MSCRLSCTQRFPPDLNPVTRGGKSAWVSEDGETVIEEGTHVRIKIVSATLESAQLVRLCHVRAQLLEATHSLTHSRGCGSVGDSLPSRVSMRTTWASSDRRRASFVAIPRRVFEGCMGGRGGARS